jgi:uncharacterized protein YycO
MRTAIWLTMLLMLAQGCATQFERRTGSARGDAEAGFSLPLLKFQRLSIEPERDEAPLAAEDLRPGDILLTSEDTLRSAGIQLMTFAPVSHAAVYVGGGEVVEALGGGVRTRTIAGLLEEETVILALRVPDLSVAQAEAVRTAALRNVGRRFNYAGVAFNLPFTFSRRLCELPMMPTAARDLCIRGVGAIHHLATSRQSYFCSQLVLQSYLQAGVPITDADPRLLSPADILHMREGDVASVRIARPLRYLGHLKDARPVPVAYGG